MVTQIEITVMTALIVLLVAGLASVLDTSFFE